jgi:parallel beta-helix repeat protein
MARRKWIVALLLVTVVAVSAARAKSVFIISQHAAPSKAQAYKIDGDQVTLQANVDISTYNEGFGAVGNTIWSAKELMFVTYENSPMIVWASTKTLEKVGEFDTGVNNLSGISVDEGKERIYVVHRDTDDLYIYSYDQGNNKLILEQHVELLLPWPNEHVTAWGTALDEQNGLLYVSNSNEFVDVFRTSNWTHDHYIEIKINDTPLDAVGIAVDPARGYLYTGGYMGMVSHEFLVRTQTVYPYHPSIESNVGLPVIGIGVDQVTGLVYCSTYHHDLRVYDSNLILRDTETSGISGPAGVAVPTGDVLYKPPAFVLTKSDNDVDCVYPYNSIEQNYLVYQICYDANGHADNNVIITDYLPLEVNYYSSNPVGTYHSDTNTVTWDIGNLSSTQSGCIQLTVQVNQYAKPGGIITNFVTIEGDNYYTEAVKDTNVCCYGGEIIYVDKDANGYNNGTSWKDAYKDLQDALAGARSCASCVTSIWVAAGTYKPTNNPSDADATFELVEGVGVFGHFGGVGTYETSTSQRNFADANNETFLDGQIGDTYTEAVHYVVSANGIENALLDGFTVTGSYDSSGLGAGVFLDDSDLGIVNCKLRNNSACGIYSTATESSFPDVHNCLFINNSSYGLWCERSRPAMTNSIFDGNNTTWCAVWANSLSVVDLTDCTATNHIESAIYATGNTDIEMENCIVKNNRYGISCLASDPIINHCLMENNGGEGLWCSSGCSPTVTNSIIRFNGTDGIYLQDTLWTTIKNNWIHNNGVGQSGCGIYLKGQIDEPLIRNNTICVNSAYGIHSYSGTEPVVTNCIVWYNNSGNLRKEGGGSLQHVTYSCIGGGYQGNGNSSAEPGFKNPTDPNDLHIAEYSPCKNAGYLGGSYDGETDIDDEARVIYDRVDMGADEYYWSSADFNGDEIVNFIDYAIFANAWQTQPGNGLYNYKCDLQDNNSIDYGDLALFCEDWLWQAGWTKTFAAGYGDKGGTLGLEGAGLESPISAATSASVALMLPDTAASIRAMPERLAAKAKKFYAVTAVEQETKPIEVKPLTIDQIIKWLEELWLTTPKVREIIDKTHWQKFMDSIKEGV